VIRIYHKYDKLFLNQLILSNSYIDKLLQNAIYPIFAL